MNDVRDYYDRQTSGFLTLGQGGHLGVIHRAVWAPGTADRAHAFHDVDDRIADLIRTLPSGSDSHIVDLGCGVGASLIYLANLLSVRGTGVTLSPVQRAIAAEHIERAGLTRRVRCLEGDYCALPADVGRADLAYAIESFVHGPDPARFFAECASLIRPGGLLVICDDFRRPGGGDEAGRAIQRFRNGWLVNSLLQASELHAHAAAAGFMHEATTDLTPWLEIGRPRDRAIDLFLALFGWLPLGRTRFAHLSGGSALQQCLARGWVAYEFAVFRRLA